MTSKPLHAVVIGGSSGIGLATAKLFTARGTLVTLVGRDPEKLERALTQVGGESRSVAMDAGERTALDSLFANIAPFDTLVIAASGGAGAGSFRDIDPAGLRKGFEAKFWVHWNAAQAALPHIAATGSITFVTAASSRLANPGTSGLAAINGALDRMVPTLARELAPVRVNAVSPGVIDTPWWANKPAGMFEAASRKAPLGRAGQPEEVAEAIVFLAQASFVTGVVLDVDGGLHLT
jgi:NAD(P)-dependent dehydrogenase (short-subunit alcohol dehydrogenase family)